MFTYIIETLFRRSDVFGHYFTGTLLQTLVGRDNIYKIQTHKRLIRRLKGRFWFDVQGWLHTSFTHCTDIIFSKELVILGSKANGVTDRILDLYILIAKYNIFIAKLRVTIPHLNTIPHRFLKNRAVLEKYYYSLNGRPNKFHADWMLYSSLLSGVLFLLSLAI